MSLKDLSVLFENLKSSGGNVAQAVGGYRTKVLCMLGMRAGRLMLIVMSKVPGPKLESSEAVEAATEDLAPGSSSLTFTLSEPCYEEFFLRFCDDLLSVMDGAPDESTALSRLSLRYETWRAFWKNRPAEMSEDKTRGLAGELLYMLHCLDNGCEPETVVQAWTGPAAGDQDFVFTDGWAEVKTIRQSATEVRITSLEQLVNPRALQESSAVRGRLAVIRLHGSPAGEKFLTLASVYKAVLERLSDVPLVRVRFINSVTMTGADMEHGRNETGLKFEFMEMGIYDVNRPGFPRIVRGEDIPEAVTKLSYCLSLPALEPWKTEEIKNGCNL